MTLDANAKSPTEWDDQAEETFDLADGEMRAAKLLLEADPPLAGPSIPHSLMGVEFLLILVLRLLGSDQGFDTVEGYLKLVSENAPDLRRSLGPLTPLKKAEEAGSADKDLLKTSKAAYRAAEKARKILCDFIEERLSGMSPEPQAEKPKEEGKGVKRRPAPRSKGSSSS
ncbi:MAG: hypothetical protein WCY56_00315 [Aminobacteriaceae bacterium]